MFKRISEDIPNRSQVMTLLCKIADELEYEKQAKFDKILDELGLELVNCVIVKKELRNE